jgi:hypothetical protein
MDMEDSMASARGEMKRYTFELPAELFIEIRQVANKQHTTVVDVIRKYIKLGLAIEKTPDNALYIREGDSLCRLMLL